MKKIGIVVPFILILIGTVGTLVTALPAPTEEFSLIERYVSAVDDCDSEKMQECMPMDQYAQLAEKFEWKEDVLSLIPNVSGTPDKKSYLEFSGLDAALLVPEEAKNVEKIELIGLCVSEEGESGEDKSYEQLLSISGSYTMQGMVKVTYINSEDKAHSVTSHETFLLMGTKDGVKLLAVI